LSLRKFYSPLKTKNKAKVRELKKSAERQHWLGGRVRREWEAWYVGRRGDLSSFGFKRTGTVVHSTGKREKVGKGGAVIKVKCNGRGKKDGGKRNTIGQNKGTLSQRGGDGALRTGGEGAKSKR